MFVDTQNLNIVQRLRRNRRTAAIRSLVQETHLHPADLVVPFFVVEGTGQRQPIPSLPRIDRLSIDLVIAEAKRLHQQGIQAIALFPCIAVDLKTEGGEEAWNPEGLIPRAARALKEALPSLCLIADVALDPFTTHGHDGLADRSGAILNDPTIECLSRMSLALAGSGIDYLAPSDMMDGRIGALRSALDENGFHQTGLLAYSIKYASSLYHPYRDAVRSQLTFGDKKTYQLNPANGRESLLEAALDEQEGADILMVKPATLYLDVIAHLRAQTKKPIAAYHVTGEYAMVMAADKLGYLQADKVLYEALLGIKRAGADLIFTYAAPLILPML